MVIRIAINILRLAVLVNLILGIIFWTGNGDAFVLLHTVLGIIAVLALWTIGLAQGMRKGGSFGIALGTFVVGFVAALVGLFQTRWLTDPGTHWIIQVIHLLLGLALIGTGEMINARTRRQAARAAA